MLGEAAPAEDLAIDIDSDPALLFGHWEATPHVAWLDSGGPVETRSRYSVLAIAPYAVIEERHGRVTLDGVAQPQADAMAVLELLLGPAKPADALPFTGGAIGFACYEFGRAGMGVATRHPPRNGFPDFLACLYDLVFVCDRQTGRCRLHSSGRPATGRERTRRAVARADWALHRMRAAAPADHDPVPDDLCFTADLALGEYHRRVERILEHIRQGDIYQANLTCAFRASRPRGVAAGTLYRALRRRSPAPFAAFLDCGAGRALASASPERFLSLGPGGRVETRPIKGTRPRGTTPQEDARLKSALEASAKDRAENLMIVDLMRNDLGRVARIGSVEVESLCALESFAQVHHLVSSVRAKLQEGVGATGLLAACLPGGSITGTPKRRAMEIIDALEPGPRGPYCGSLFRIGFDGTMDSSILIRTLAVDRDSLTAQAGGGIVADSSPEAEWEELLTKLEPLLLGGRIAPCATG